MILALIDDECISVTYMSVGDIWTAASLKSLYQCGQQS